MDVLTDRQRRFALEYVTNGGNGQAAALAAGYSPASAKSVGQWLVGHPGVGALMRREQSVRLAAASVTRERVLAEIARLAFGDARKLFNESGQLRAPSDLDDDTAATLAGVEVRQTRVLPIDSGGNRNNGGDNFIGNTSDRTNGNTRVPVYDDTSTTRTRRRPAPPSGSRLAAGSADVGSPSARDQGTEYAPAVQVEQVAKVKLWDKTKPLELLAKITGLVPDGRLGTAGQTTLLAPQASVPIDTSVLSDEELDNAIALAQRLRGGT